MVGFISLPQYESPRNALWNFGPITQAIESNQQNALAQQRMGMEQKRLGFEEQRLGLEKERAGQQTQSWHLEHERNLAKHYGGLAQMWLDEKDPTRQMGMYQRVATADPRFQGVLDKILPKPLHGDPVAVGRAISAIAKGYQDPLEQRGKLASIQQTEQGTANAILEGKMKQRELDTPPLKTVPVKEGERVYTIDPRVAGGAPKLLAEGGDKMTDEQRKAILDTDQNIQSGYSTLATLNQIRKLNKTAYDGRTAGVRSYVGSTFGATAAQDTEVMHTLITSQALEQLKATFGAAPTEGERKILLEIQGSINQPAAVRDRIFQRAEELVAARQRMNVQRAHEIRSGTYFKPGGGTATSPTQQTAQPQSGYQPEEVSRPIPRVQSDADYEALPSGTTFLDPNGRKRTKP